MYDSASLASDGFRQMGFDLETGREVWVKIEGTKMTVREFAPVDELLEDNAELRSETAGTRHADGLSLVARIPEHIMHNRLMEALRQGDNAYLDRWLNDPDHAKFRVRSGRI